MRIDSRPRRAQLSERFNSAKSRLTRLRAESAWLMTFHMRSIVELFCADCGDYKLKNVLAQQEHFVSNQRWLGAHEKFQKFSICFRHIWRTVGMLSENLLQNITMELQRETNCNYFRINSRKTCSQLAWQFENALSSTNTQVELIKPRAEFWNLIPLLSRRSAAAENVF